MSAYTQNFVYLECDRIIGHEGATDLRCGAEYDGQDMTISELRERARLRDGWVSSLDMDYCGKHTKVAL